MRAIGALVTSFLCLAAVQAGYMLVEAHRNHEAEAEVAASEQDQEALAPQRLPLERRPRKHEPHLERRPRKHEPQLMHTKDAPANTSAPTPVRTAALRAEGSRQQALLSSHAMKDRQTKSNHNDNVMAEPSESQEPNRKAQKHRKPKSTHHTHPINVYVPGTQSNQSAHQLLQVAIQPPNLTTDHQQTSPTHAQTDPFMTNTRADTDTHKSKPKSPDKFKMEHSVESKKTSRHYSPEDKRQIRLHQRARYTHRRGRKHRRAHRSCDSTSDCGHGDCCIERKAGKKFCLPGGVKSVGKHCLDVCLCKPGLQCYVQPNKHKKPVVGKQPAGKCVKPDQADITRGFLLPPPSIPTINPSTPQP